MHGMRTQVRRFAIAAATALVLVLPLGPTQSAQAAPSADLSITKQVRAWSETSIAVPDDFNPTWGDTRSNGGYELSGTGLRVWTAANAPCVPTCLNKAAEYVDTDTALDTLAGQADPSLSYTPLPENNANNQVPGFQLVTDVDNDGTADTILVGEPTHNGKWWAGRYKGQASLPASVTTGAPHAAGGGGPSNGPWGTLAEWDASFPNAKVVAFGFSLGSNSGENNGRISAMNFNGKAYTFGGWGSSITANPGATVQYKLTVQNDSDADIDATGTTITDTLPDDLTYVPGSLKAHVSLGCGFVDRTLTCNAGTFPIGFATTIYFRATISNTITSDDLPKTIGHNVDVQKQETFLELPAGKTRTGSAFCPSGYRPTDGGLLIDSVDQGGFYTDIVTMRSKPTTSGGLKGWTVTATNLGDFRGQGKVKVTCLDETIGSASNHTHNIVVTSATGAGTSALISPGTLTQSVCPVGYTPIAPWFDVTSGYVNVRSSHANVDVWAWIFDYEAGAATFTFGAECLAAETSAAGGHSAGLVLTTTDSTIPLGAEGRTEGVQQCGPLAHAITGGYHTNSFDVYLLGKEQRGTNYMFRFWNDDWENAWNAYLQVQCVGVRTPDERTYYTVTNTARVTTTSADRTTADDTSSAVVKIDGPPVTPPGGVAIGGTATRTFVNGNVKYIVVGLTCTEACPFTAKVLRNDTVVAKVTKSLPASPNQKSVSVPTTSAGRSIGAVQVVIKVKTESGTNTKTVTLS